MQSDKPKVSIITPTFNRADYILESVDSVLAQSFQDWELLIVDDGSYDNTKELLQPYLNDQRIHYFYQQNQGQSVARNYALTKALGEFVCFLDSDNRWLPFKLHHQIGLMEKKPDVGVVYGDVATINESGEEISRKNMKRYSGHIAAQMLKDNCVSMNTAMARRTCFEQIGGAKKNRRVADDYEIWLRISARFIFHYESDFYAEYRVMEDQISSDKRRRFEANEEIILDFLKEFPDAVSRTERRKGLCFFYSRKARYYATIGDYKTAFSSIRKALTQQPLGMPGWRALARVMVPR